MSSCLEANKSMAHSELIQVPCPAVPWGFCHALGIPPSLNPHVLPQNFLNSGSCPEVQGFLQLREAGRKVWKRFHFSLRRSGLYYSTKGTSKVRPGGFEGRGHCQGVQWGQP